jgi:TP901 family phage tail tape measure protein
VADRIVAVGLTVNTAQYVAGMNKASAAAAQTATSTQRVGTSVDKTKSSMISFKNIALYAFGYGVAAGVVKVGMAAIKTLMGFENAMAELGAASMASADELEAMSEAALDAGVNTVFTATQAADAMTELAKAGVSTSDILGGALTGALDLAAAGQVDVAFAAETAATAMVQFGLSGEDVVHIADVLAAGAGKAQGGVEELAMALRQGGQVAAMVGWEFEDTATALTAFASAGLLGSDAGTSLKTMLLRLSAPTNKAREEMQRLGISVYDSNGNMLGARALAGELRDAFGGLEPAARNAALGIIFGTDAVRAANILYAEGPAGILEWELAVNDTGYAAEVAAAKMDTLSGDMQRLKGTIESMAIDSSGGLLGALREIVQLVDKVITGVNTVNDLFPTFEAPTGQEFKFDLFKGAAFQLGDMLYYLNDQANAARGVGEATQEAIEKALAGADAFQRHADQVRGLNKVAAEAGFADPLVESLEDVEEAAEEAADQIDAMKDAILALGETFTDIEAARDAVTAAGEKALQPLRDLEGARKDLTEAQKDLAEADSDASREGAQEAVTRAEQAVAAAEAAITLKGNSEAARENRDSLRDMADKIKNTSAELLDLDKSGYASRAEMEKGRLKFIEVAMQLGYTKTEAEKYARQLGLIPGEVPTNVYINGYDEAMRRAQNIARAISGIDRDVAIRIVTTEIRREETYASNSSTGYQTGSATGRTRVFGDYNGDGIPDNQQAAGGWVKGRGTSTSDSIATWLSRGEFVVNARAASDYAPLLEAINSGKMGGGFQVNMGGINGSTPQATAQAVVNALRAQSYLMGV